MLGSNQADWLGNPTWALLWMMVVAIFVSLPFTTYAILSGLQGIPREVYEASASTARPRGSPTCGSRCRCCGRRSWSRR